MKNILFVFRTKLNTTSKLIFISFPINKVKEKPITKIIVLSII